ncbi:respiratory nitrate reductase subunit gamma [Streptomyces sp. NPDC048420]|uniref:respiratory nitrate reductase subunit gamma n=1 Tax=Streptomyces sp. NPDC048420 TaxID=3155755 RepID=UPI0034264138
MTTLPCGASCRTSASNAFHCGSLFVLAGHVVGLFVPVSWTDSIGIGEQPADPDRPGQKTEV